VRLSAQQVSLAVSYFLVSDAAVKKLTEGKAILVAFIASAVSLLTTFGVGVILRTASSAKQSESHSINAENTAQGRRLFVKHCAECHGYDGRGGEGSDLHNLRAGDALIRQVIGGGIKGEMPAYGKALSEADVRALTTYLRTLRN
jgi:mono/diheme cytochrome c family protein